MFLKNLNIFKIIVAILVFSSFLLTYIIKKDEKQINHTQVSDISESADVVIENTMSNYSQYTNKDVPITFIYPSYFTLYNDHSVDGVNIRTQAILYEKQFHPELQVEDEAVFIDAPSIVVKMYQKTNSYVDLSKWIRTYPYSTFFVNFHPSNEIRKVEIGDKTAFLFDADFLTYQSGVYVLEMGDFVVEVIDNFKDGNSSMYKKYQLAVEDIIQSLK